MPQGISAHGTTIEIALPGSPSSYIEIAEVGDMQMPGFTRNEFDITSHNRDIDTWILGVQRRDPVTFPLFFNKAISSHITLRDAQLNGDPTTNMNYGWRVTSPDGDILIFSGGVKEFKRTAPVDGPQTGNVVIRPTGEFILNGVRYGT